LTVHRETKWVGSARITGESAPLIPGPKKTSMIQMNMSRTVPLTGFGTVAPTIAPNPR